MQTWYLNNFVIEWHIVYYNEFFFYKFHKIKKEEEKIVDKIFETITIKKINPLLIYR